ncbi:hypothetical protein ARMGADRAFT_1033045 [Armillaria gallica]|uniref:Uncharacterized protein n=1 Tax=Armillaria gallica TaxID=47427 RepID=A0A2H3DF33_ARMGA|nr:hypothetical protein ARMGADRAFT_1033045 [Armillaria gallica]
MRAAQSTIGDDIQDEEDIFIEHDNVNVESADSTREISSDHDKCTSNKHHTQGELDITWEEVKYKVNGDFEDSDGYEFLEHMAIMREDEETEKSSDKGGDTTAYEIAVEEIEPD